MRISVIVCIVSVIVCVLIDIALYAVIRNYSRHKSRARTYIISSAILWAVLIAVLSVPRRGETDILPVMWMLYAFLTVYIAKVIGAVFMAVGFIPKLWHGKVFSAAFYVGLLSAVSVLSVMWYGALSTRKQIQVNRIVVSSSDLPRSFRGFTIAQISDLHVGTWGHDTSFLTALVDSINANNPDVVVFTGDLVNRKSSELKPFMSVLSKIKAPEGVYSILGNHDYGDYMNWKTPDEKIRNLMSLKDMQDAMNWKLLDNTHVYLKNNSDSIALIGVGNWGKPPFHVYGDLSRSYPDLNDSVFKVLLSHDPDHWNMEVLQRSNVDLTLSGHTHAMQFMIGEWSPAQYKYENWGGFYSVIKNGRKRFLYVNIGSGTVGIPARIGSAKPEITILTLE